MKENQITERWVAARYIRENGTILDFTGLYEVSDLGRVRSLNYHQTGKARVMNYGTYRNKDGTIFYQVILRLNGKRYAILVHRLVLSSFRPKGHSEGYFYGAVCDHIVARTETDCCDHLDNLHWVTPSQNSNTEHCKTLQSIAHTNHPGLSKRVRVTDLTTGEATVYPSASEAGRVLGINPNTPGIHISKCKGFYKKLNLHFAYV